ncbi:hypothetical protein J4419_02995 [Candidatus Woesearchaeota archaeon]|nr:hypothetical protein [Candidatus Woesearchaeota archaeon]
MLTEEEYACCIRGFLHLSQKIIDQERKESSVKEDLLGYFFDDAIHELAKDETFLLSEVQRAFKRNLIQDNQNRPLDARQLRQLKTEGHLLPFFEWA